MVNFNIIANKEIFNQKKIFLQAQKTLEICVFVLLHYSVVSSKRNN